MRHSVPAGRTGHKQPAPKTTKPGDRGTKRVAAKRSSKPSADQPRWRGEEVQSRDTGESAEEAAARAEGNAPLSAQQAAAGGDQGTFLEPELPPPRSAPGDDEENIEEKRQSAAEDHAGQPGHGPIRGRL